MASYPKISDNEMDYFKFKAKQTLLLKKEDKEWQDFCKQIAPDCAACLAEKTDLKESKDVGIQTVPKRPMNKTVSSTFPERTSVQSKYKNEKIPEDLINIKTRLENIDLVLSKLCEIEMEKKPVIQKMSSSTTLPMFYNERNFKPSDNVRTFLTHDNLQINSQKLQKPVLGSGRSSAIKPKNSGYFLPHDLQVKRIAARKAYLASLQNKPKVQIQNTRKNVKNDHLNQNKGIVLKNTSKSKKKVVTMKVPKISVMDEEKTVIEAEDAKDENIESVIDGILENLLGEAAIDLNRIRQKKGKQNSTLSRNRKTNTDEASEVCLPSGSFTSSPTKNTEPKVIANDDNKGIEKLKLFLDSSEKAQHESDSNRKEKLIDKSTITSPTEDLTTVKNPIVVQKSSIHRSPFEENYKTKKPPPKFVCSISNTITVDPEKARSIAHNKDRFWSYLKNISRTVKGNFNPWVLNEMLAESILDDSIDDISKELSELPSNFVQDIYNQEFEQQVEN